MFNLLGSLALVLGLSGSLSAGVSGFTQPSHVIRAAAAAQDVPATVFTDSAAAPVALVGVRGVRESAPTRKQPFPCPAGEQGPRGCDIAGAICARALDQHDAATIATRTFPPRAPPDHN
jgi:hypothetical protein